MISFVLAVYNEEKRIVATLDRLSAFLDSRFNRWEIAVVDDGSTDGTRAVVSQWASRTGAQVRVLGYPVNAGKGCAVRLGMLEAKGDPVFFTDADLPYDLAAVPLAMDRFERGADLVIGDRTHPASTGWTSHGILRSISHLAFSMVVRLLVLRGVADTQAGFKAFRREATREIFPLTSVNRFAFDVELLLIAKKRGCRIARVPVKLIRGEGSTVRVSRDSPEMLRALLAIRRRDRLGLYDPADRS